MSDILDRTEDDGDPATAIRAATLLASAARRTALHMVKGRARRYAKRPMMLDALYPGLAQATPAGLIAVAAHLIERESRTPRRWFGFGGEVNLVNARAAHLLGRVLRRQSARA